jgi:hypothetical protein
LLMGTILIYVGDLVLGVNIELFSGFSSFNIAWALDIFFVPFLMGMMVAWIFGRDATHSGEGFRFTKGIGIIIWVCYLPPLFVRGFNYFKVLYVTGVPEGTFLMPWGLWACFVVMTMTTAGMGEIIGEVIIKIYGKTSQTENMGGIEPSSNEEPRL